MYNKKKGFWGENMAKRIRKFLMILLGVVFVGLCVAVAITLVALDKKKTKLEDPVVQYQRLLQDHKYIMHALGGVENTYTYTNSLDAMQLAYDEGERFFEADISFTSDKQLVLAHCNGKGAFVNDGEDNTWNENDWENRLGQVYNPKHPLATYDEFMNFTIQEKFTANSFSDLVDFMREHKDVYVTLDIGGRSYNETKKIYQAITETCDMDTKVLNRFIASGKTTDMVLAIKEVYDFPFKSMYFSKESEREEKVKTPEQFYDFCQENGVSCFATAYEVYEGEKLVDTILLESDMYCYVYTVDVEEKAETLIEEGVTAVGTNFLRDRKQEATSSDASSSE